MTTTQLRTAILGVAIITVFAREVYRKAPLD